MKTLLALLISTTPVLAHEATNIAGQPLGWAYPYSCCSDKDCRPILRTDVTEGPDGYVVHLSKAEPPIAYNSTIVKESPDGEYHWCTFHGEYYGAKQGTTRCLFVPPKGF